MTKSVDEILDEVLEFYTKHGKGSFQHGFRYFSAKEQLLKLVLECLPERCQVDTNPLTEDDYNDNHAAINYNSGLDQTEKNLRRIFK